jgi:hypothetical protein
MTMSFEEAFAHQGRMQIEVYGDGTPFAEWSDDRRAVFIKNCSLALLDEVHEALGEVGWKPWASSRHLNKDAFQGELVDALHFFFNLMHAAGITPEALLEGYEAKAAKNRQRQIDGYDGVSTKCPVCHRALDDDAVHCVRPEFPEPGICVMRKAKLGQRYDLDADGVTIYWRARV